jgi:hypothetical protein
MKTRMNSEVIYSGRDLSWFDEKKKKGRTTFDNKNTLNAPCREYVETI